MNCPTLNKQNILDIFWTSFVLNFIWLIGMGGVWFQFMKPNFAHTLNKLRDYIEQTRHIDYDNLRHNLGEIIFRSLFRRIDSKIKT